MITIVSAIYENGILRPKQPLPLKQGTVVEFPLNLPEEASVPARFSWEDGPILALDSFDGSVSDEIRRQRDEE